jgi:hypothetical protein
MPNCALVGDRVSPVQVFLQPRIKGAVARRESGPGTSLDVIWFDIDYMRYRVFLTRTVPRARG